MKLTLHDDQAILPWDNGALPALEALEGQAPASSALDSGAITLRAREPGLYLLKVPAIPGYEPVSDEIVRLEKGVVKEHTIQLRRLP